MLPSNTIAKQVQVDEKTYDDLKKIYIDVKRIISQSVSVKITLGQFITHVMKDAITSFNKDQESFMANLKNEIEGE